MKVKSLGKLSWSCNGVLHQCDEGKSIEIADGSLEQAKASGLFTFDKASNDKVKELSKAREAKEAKAETAKKAKDKKSAKLKAALEA